MSLNRATIIGHIGQDPELRYLPTSGQPVTDFSVATDESFTDKEGQRQERTDWHQVVVYGKAVGEGWRARGERA
jgi:single-strand DNA-binding protein